MEDRFKDAKWYIRSERGRHDRIDPLSTIIYDASDLEGTGPDGHGMVCLGATLEDARLISLAPTLLRIVKTLLASWECDPDEDAQYEDLMDQAVGEAREAIAKAEGRPVCQDGSHDCFNTGQPCGCRCDDCRDDTEPRCDICNGLINKYGSAIGHCENESGHEGRA